MNGTWAFVIEEDRVKYFFVILSLVFSPSLWAKRAPVQLMPATTTPAKYDSEPVSDEAEVRQIRPHRSYYYVAALERTNASAQASTVRYKENSPSYTSPTQLGVELGIVGRKQAEGEFLGMQALMGARGFIWVPVYNSFSIKPSLGYFFKKENMGSVSVTQNHLEAGLGLFMTVHDDASMKLNIGLSNRLTRATSNTSVMASSSTGPAELFARSGPAIGFLIRLGGRMHLAADAEYTWSFQRPTRNFFGLSSGIAFEL